MALPNNPLVAKVSLVGNRDTREWVNTFHVAKTAGPLNGGDLLTIAQTFYNWWHNFYRHAFTAGIVLDVIEVRKLDPLDPLALDYTTNLPETGDTPGTLEPGNVSATLSWRTGLAGRKFRGRDFIPGIPDSFTTEDDRMTSGYLATLTSIAIQYLLAINGISPDMDPVVFHKLDNTTTEIISFVINAVFDSMRRRLPGRGR